jgi:hypothetical protein
MSPPVSIDNILQENVCQPIEETWIVVYHWMQTGGLMMRAMAILAVCAMVLSGCGQLKDDAFIALGDWSFRVNGQSIQQSVKVSGSEMTEEGFIFVKVNMTFKNDTDQPRAFMAGMFTMELEDSAGSSSMNELFVEGGLDTADVKSKSEVTGDFFFKMQGNMQTNPSGMKLKLMNIGMREEPKAEYILK